MCDMQRRWRRRQQQRHHKQQPQFHRSIIQMNWVEFSNKFYTQKWGSESTHHFAEAAGAAGGVRSEWVYVCKCQCECGFWLFGVERHVCHLHELGTDMFLPTFFCCAHGLSLPPSLVTTYLGDGIHSISFFRQQWTEFWTHTKKQKHSDMWCACSHHLVKMCVGFREKAVVIRSIHTFLNIFIYSVG